jgi:hypothetical protein
MPGEAVNVATSSAPGQSERTIVRRLRGNASWAVGLAVAGWIATAGLAALSFLMLVLSASVDAPKLVRGGAYIYAALALLLAGPSLLATRYARFARSAWQGDWQRPLAGALRQEVRLLRVITMSLVVAFGWIPVAIVIGFIIGLIVGVMGG